MTADRDGAQPPPVDPLASPVEWREATAGERECPYDPGMIQQVDENVYLGVHS